MSRKYGNILTAIWRHDEFRGLSREAQHGYLQLATQPDISAAGVLALSINRWASQSRGTTPAMVMAVLAELQEKRFIVFDTTTEELLVRSFVRWDGGYTNSKRRPVIERAAMDVISPTIQRVLAAEFRRLELNSLADRLSGSLPPEPSKPPVRDQGEFEFPHVDTVSGTVPPSDGVVVTEVSTDTATHNPQTPAATPLRADATIGQRSKAITDAYHAIESMCNWPAVNGVVTKAIRTGRWTDEEIHAAMLRLAESGRSVTTDSLRVELTGFPAARQGPPSNVIALRGRAVPQSTRDDRFNEWLTLPDPRQEAYP